MESTALSPAPERYFWLRFMLLLFGYAIAISGPLLIFQMPLHVCFLCIIVGSIMVIVGFVKSALLSSPRLSKPYVIIVLIGWLVILGALQSLGDDRIRHWRPHPAGYTSAWVILVFAVQHVQQSLSRYLEQQRKAE